MDRKIAFTRKAHWLVAQSKHDQNQLKSFPFLSLDNKQRNANIVYGAFGESYMVLAWFLLIDFLTV